LFDLLGIHIHGNTIHIHGIYQVSIGTLATHKLLAALPGRVGNPPCAWFWIWRERKVMKVVWGEKIIIGT